MHVINIIVSESIKVIKAGKNAVKVLFILFKSMKSLLYSKSSFVIEHFEDFTVKLCEVLARERT